MRKLISTITYLAAISFLVAGCSPRTAPDIVSPTNAVAPVNVYPPDGSLNEQIYVTVKWECSGSPVDYTVFYSKDPAGPYLKASNTPTLNKYLTLPILAYNTKYYWKVSANYGSGITVESKPWAFTTVTSSGSQNFNGFALRLHEIHTEQPYWVYSTFQVMDLSGLGVSTMKQSDFEITEDYQKISVSESKLQITNHATVPYEIKTVLMLDNSTSVLGKSAEIIAAANQIIQNAKPYQSFAVYVFSDKIVPLTGGNFVDMITAQNSLGNYFNGYESTDFYGAVVEGTKMWKDEFTYRHITQGNLIIISDGGDTQRRYTLTDAVNATRDKLIYTLFVNSTDEQPEVMNEIGTGGSFGIAELSGVLNQLSDLNGKVLNYAGSFYDLGYSSPKRDQRKHILSISVPGNPYSGEESVINADFVLP